VIPMIGNRLNGFHIEPVSDHRAKAAVLIEASRMFNRELTLEGTRLLSQAVPYRSHSTVILACCEALVFAI
jgi:hypothetical protein